MHSELPHKTARSWRGWVTLGILLLTSVPAWRDAQAVYYNLGAFWRKPGVLLFSDLQQKLVTPAGAPGRRSISLGSSSALSEDGLTLLVGALKDPWDASDTRSSALDPAGAAYVFVKSGGTWSKQAKLAPSGTNARISGDEFGYSVALSGDTALVGARSQPFDGSGANSLEYAGAAYIFTRSGTTWSQEAKLVATGTNARISYDRFGSSVALSGDTALVGAQYQAFDGSGASSLYGAGAAYVFTRSGTSWSQQAKLVATGTNARKSYDAFGSSVALSGDTALIGARSQAFDASGANSVGGAGAAFVFTRSGTSWSQEAKLVATGTNARKTYDYFGSSVALSGDTALVGATQHSFDALGANSVGGAGAAFVFTRSGTSWSQQQKLVATGTNARKTYDYFGSSVALSGDTALIGTTQHSFDASGANSVSLAGAAFVFTRSGTSWSQQQKLVATGTNARISGDYFGTSVALSGDTALIGANQQSYDAAGANYVPAAGAAYTFTRSGTTWSQEQKLVGPDQPGSYPDYTFGAAIALSENANTLLVGAQSADGSGAAYVFVRSGPSWTFQSKLVPTGANARAVYDWFGYSVALSGDTALIGAYGHSFDASGASSLDGAGAAWVFTRSGTTWSQQQKLVATGTNARMGGDGFGISVALSGETALIGAWYQSYNATGASSVGWAGAAYVFTRSGTTWSQEAKLVATGTNARKIDDEFGYSVALSGDTALIGAWYQDYNATGGSSLEDAGAAYVFTRSGTTWSQQAKLVATGVNARRTWDNFGGSVALSGDTALIGDPYHSYDASGGSSSDAAGAVFVFTRSGTTWTQQQKLVATGTNARISGDYFGTSVALSGDRALIGSTGQAYDAPGVNSAGGGAAYVFTRSGTTWSQQQKLVATGANARPVSLGTSVALAKEVVAIGDDSQDYDSYGVYYGSSSGAVFVTGALASQAVASFSKITGTSPVAVNGNSTVTITLRNFMGAPVSGVVPSCAATGSAAPCGSCGATNAQGIATCTLTSTAAGTKTLWITSPVSGKGANVVFQ